MTHKIVFEQPLNERIRTFLRIEQLVKRFRHAVKGESIWDTHFALSTLLEIADLAARGDLKSEVMKELKRQIGNLEGLSDTPGIDYSHLQSIIDGHRRLVGSLHELSGQPGNKLKTNEFISSIKQRAVIPGGTCDFDLPAYHFWLSQPNSYRNSLLQQWFRPFELIHEPMEVILNLIRQSTTPEKTIATKGFLQQNLESNIPYQLIRISIPENSPYFPEISAGKHRFTVRFLTLTNIESRAPQTQDDLEFELACCAL